jgi:hypothetical protein
MALEDLPGELVTPTRADIVAKYQRDAKLRNPASETGPGTQPELDGRLIADHLLPVYGQAITVANGTNEDAATGPRLDRVGARWGVPRPKARGARGHVKVSASASGGTIQAGTECKSRQTNRKYEAAETRSLQDGQHIAIRGIDTGPSTDLPPGSVLQWSSPPNGIGALATVVAQADGSGLSGGADVAIDGIYQPLIKERRTNPPASANDAQIRDILSRTPDVPIEKVYTYPCVLGPSSTAFTFTVTASKVGASRRPTTVQLQAALAQLLSELPPDSAFPLEMLSDPFDLALEIEWSGSVRGWTDSSPWPRRYTGAPGAIVVDTVTSATSFVLKTSDSNYSGVVQPVVGQTIGVWDSGNFRFRRKQIKSFTGTGPWSVVFETANGASDTNYAPTTGQKVFPWSESAPTLVDAVLGYLATFGPGEMFASFPGDDRRQRRQPLPGKSYPQKITAALTTPVIALDAVQDAAIVEGSGETPALGTPGVDVSLLELGNFCLFPKTS